MERRLVVALLVSVVLIGAATWQRVSRVAGDRYGSLVAASNAPKTTLSEEDVDNLAALYTQSSTSTSATSSEKLTDTDLVVRQLFSDYIDLSSKGQATQANLDTLGSKYADTISTLNKAPSITAADLTVVDNSKANLSAYAKNISTIYTKYHAQLTSQVKPNANYTDFGLDLVNLSNHFADLYGKEAAELKALPVPQALLADHVKYTNIYLSHAWDMKAIANSDEDPADASAAVSMESSILQEEQDIATDIQRILISGGIIVDTP